jgi:REP element-mobilizing transposase RayT
MHGRHLQFAQGCCYHLYNRGANRASIFLDDADYIAFLTRLQKATLLHGATVLAYCLMPNHFHLLLRQDGEDRSGKAVQCASNGYAQYFNRRHNHTGTLFQGRYQRILVADDEYLRHLCRYIHTNPVKDGFALLPELWLYSNYREWLGLRTSRLFDPAFVSAMFGSPTAYQQYIAAWPNRDRLPAPLRTYLDDLERQE